MAKVLKEGLVEKRGEGVLAGWKERWIVLYDNKTIEYYTDKSKKQLKGKIHINDDSLSPKYNNVSDAVHENNKEKNGFNIACQSRIWQFRCQTSQERDDWITAIQASFAANSFFGFSQQQEQKQQGDVSVVTIKVESSGPGRATGASTVEAEMEGGYAGAFDDSDSDDDAEDNKAVEDVKDDAKEDIPVPDLDHMSYLFNEIELEIAENKKNEASAAGAEEAAARLQATKERKLLQTGVDIGKYQAFISNNIENTTSLSFKEKRELYDLCYQHEFGNENGFYNNLLELLKERFLKFESPEKKEKYAMNSGMNAKMIGIIQLQDNLMTFQKQSEVIWKQINTTKINKKDKNNKSENNNEQKENDHEHDQIKTGVDGADNEMESKINEDEDEKKKNTWGAKFSHYFATMTCESFDKKIKGEDNDDVDEKKEMKEAEVEVKAQENKENKENNKEEAGDAERKESKVDDDNGGDEEKESKEDDKSSTSKKEEVSMDSIGGVRCFDFLRNLLLSVGVFWYLVGKISRYRQMNVKDQTEFHKRIEKYSDLQLIDVCFVNKRKQSIYHILTIYDASQIFHYFVDIDNDIDKFKDRFGKVRALILCFFLFCFRLLLFFAFCVLFWMCL